MDHQLLHILFYFIIFQYIINCLLFLFLSLLPLAHSLRLKDCLPPHPVIGLYTQPYHTNSTTNKTYIPASYANFIEMSGTQVLPIYSLSKIEHILDLLTKLNRVLFTGGSTQINISGQWTKNAEAILNYAKQNDKPFPIFGTCQGLQLLGYLTSNYNESILTQIHGNHNTVLPIKIVNKLHLFEIVTPPAINLKLKEGGGILFFNHDFAITLDTFHTNQYLMDFWKIAATSSSNHQNQQFVAAMQSKRYPFYAVQFHPQKNQFEWKVDANRSLEPIQVSQIISNQFIEIARKNNNRFSSSAEFTDLSIYNFGTETNDEDFTQVYLLDETPYQGRIDQHIGNS